MKLLFLAKYFEICIFYRFIRELVKNCVAIGEKTRGFLEFARVWFSFK